MKNLLLAALALCASATCLATVGGRTSFYALPAERPVELPSGKGSELTSTHCSACHSLDYVTTQPRDKGPQFWRDSVAKMINTYGAPISPVEAEEISTYLAATYGG